MSDLIDVGSLSSPHGIKGWVKINSQTEPASNIFDYQPWYLKTKHGLKKVELLEWRAQGKGFVALIKGIEDRTQAEILCPVGVMVEKTLLPSLDAGEYYWHQLEQCRVVTIHNDNSVDLGKVKRLIETGSNDVLVVVGDDLSSDREERLIPYIPDQFIINVDLEAKMITVDWDPDF